MPYKSTHIQRKIICVAMCVEKLQIWKVATKFQDFIKSAKILIGRIIKQGALINLLKKVLLKKSNNHEECFVKFRETNDYILSKLL